MKKNTHPKMTCRSKTKLNTFHTSFALVLSAAFLTVLVLLSLAFSGQESDVDRLHSFERSSLDLLPRRLSERRLLQDNDANSTSGAKDTSGIISPSLTPTSLYFGTSSCGEIMKLTSPDEPEIRCAFARTCNDGEGIFLSTVFCNNERLSTAGWCILLSPALLLWMVLLFRMLGSTAEDYFSPSLEMFSLKLGLPPRFAGVSLLAVGNGAPDLSASINAIVADPNKGYRLILGSLSGAGMFIGTVVAGSIIFATNGIVCRGALIRDIVVYMIAVIVVSTQLMKGSITSKTIVLFFSIYFGYVALVFAADMYHRLVCVPQMKKSIEAEAINQMAAAKLDGKTDVASYGLPTSTMAIVRDNETRNIVPEISTSPSYQKGEDVPQAKPLHDEESTGVRQPRTSKISGLISSFSDYRPESFRLEQPIVLHGREGVLDKHEHTHAHSPQHTRRRSSSGGVLSLVGTRKPLAEIDEEDGLNEDEEYTDGDIDLPTLHVDAFDYADTCSGWCGVFQRAFFELRLYWEEIMDDIFYCEDRTRIDKFLLACELPFTIARKLTVSIPSEGYYCRPVVGLSLSISPIWIAFYLSTQMDVAVNDHVHTLYASCAISVLAGSMIIRYGGIESLSLWATIPVSLYGFVVAATWIDYIGAHLVRLLAFFGAVCRIPNPVMGLTVLAWGNSMGDLSTNVTMARKGLGNMGTTACFAGPCFTLLCGLGSGFAALLASDPNLTVIKVTMPPSVKVGFASIICNCLLLILSGLLVFRRGGKIGTSHAYLMLMLYASYLATCIALQFTNVVKSSL